MLTELSETGFTTAAIPGSDVNDLLAVEVPGAGVVSARVDMRDAVSIRCTFVDPLPRVGIDTARDEFRHWPRRTRWAVAVGGAAALWGLIALAFI